MSKDTNGRITISVKNQGGGNSAELIQLRGTGNLISANFRPDSGVQLYGRTGSNSAAVRLETNSTGVDITGNLNVDGVLTYEDVTNIDSVGVVTARDIIFSGSTGTAGQFVLRRDSDGANIGQFKSDAGTNDISIGNGGSGSLILKTGANTERLRIHSSGVAQFTTTGTQYVSASAPSFVVNSNGDHALVLNNQNTTDPRGLFIYQDQDVNNGTSYFWRARAGSSDKAHLYTNGNLNISGGLEAASVNLQSSNTNSWFQTGANYGGTDYVWAAKNSSTNVWHSGLQTDGDLFLGGNISGTSNIKLNGSNGSALFTGALDADPVHLNANYSWLATTYGAISNSTVSSLNNLLIGQNMRGWIGTRDGGSPNNNFYSRFTFGAGTLGHAGTEYCYNGLTKFYNDTAASTANASFTPNETARIDTSGLIVNNGLRISTTSGGTTLANPYSLGSVSTATIPSYPHFTGIWVVTGSVPCNNTWYDLLHSINDSNGLFHGYSGDASSKNIFQYQYSLTSPAYGVNILSQRFMNGAWNTGSVSFQLRNNSGPWTLQIKATSHYNSNNNAGFRIMFHSYY